MAQVTLGYDGKYNGKSRAFSITEQRIRLQIEPHRLVRFDGLTMQVGPMNQFGASSCLWEAPYGVAFFTLGGEQMPTTVLMRVDASIAHVALRRMQKATN